jgi:membrane-associated protease RseP (regulator of RpoE activity)
MRNTLIFLPIITFIAGLLTGATVFSQPAPPSDGTSRAPAELGESEVRTTIEPSAAVAVAVPVAEEPTAAPAQAEPPALDPEVVKRAVADETDQLRQRVDDLAEGWGRMQAELAALRARLVTLERRPLSTAAGDDQDDGRPATPQSAQQRRELLVEAGVSPEQADEIVWRDAQTTMSRLELRDTATREGWLGTERYRDELRQLSEDDVPLRDEIGDRAYDRWLYLSGEDNRIAVDRVIPGSVGEEAGLQPGDIVESYDGEQVFDFQDLSAATSRGERDQLVSVRVRRGGQDVELWLPRGPIGIQLDATRVEPSP